MQDQDEAFSSIDIVSQCLIDEPRTLAFEQAIASTVSKDDVVIDIGTGSGIMALFAARSGAKEVYALEYDKYLAKIADTNFKNNNFQNIKELLTGDARGFKYPENLNFSVVVMEMLTTGMIDEYQIQAINNLHKQNKVSDKTKFIPQIQKTFISLVNSSSDMYGLKLKMVKHLWNNLSQHLRPVIMSEAKLLNSVDFRKPNKDICDVEINLTADKDGTVNGVLLTSETVLTDLIVLKDTETLNAPVVVPIDDIEVRKGDTLNIKIVYKFGGGYSNFNIKIV